jgi:hypothetical protein
MVKMVWCVRHKDGYCASKTPDREPAYDDSMATLCDHFITMPGGVRKGMPRGSGAGERPRQGLGQSPRISLPAGEAGASGAAGAPERLMNRRSDPCIA